MITSLTRRRLMASVGLSAISLGGSVVGLGPTSTRASEKPDGKRVTLLHFTDTHAQLETHPDYLPGAKFGDPNDGRLRPSQNGH